MYYEYHLENGVIMNSEKPYVDGFYLDCGEQMYCPDLDEWYEIDSFIKVSYCLLKEGDLCNRCSQLNCRCDDELTHWIENHSLS